LVLTWLAQRMDTAKQYSKKNLEDLKSLVLKIDNKENPFLYYLPSLLQTKPFSRFNPENALLFTTAALKYNSHPVVSDALRILNNIIQVDDGSLKQPSPHHFFNNQHFFWNELGGHTSAVDVISHVFNRTIFFLSIAKNY